MNRTDRRTMVSVLRVTVLAGLLTAGCQRVSPAERHFNEGAEHFRNGDADAAIDAFHQGLELEPDSAVGHNLLGMAYRQKFNHQGETRWKEREIAAFRQSLAADSTYWPAHLNLGASLYYLGRIDEAAGHLRQALSLHPENPQRSEIEEMIREAGEAVPEVSSG